MLKPVYMCVLSHLYIVLKEIVNGRILLTFLKMGPVNGKTIVYLFRFA